MYSSLSPFHCQVQQKRYKCWVVSKRPRIFYLKFLLAAWTLFLRYIVLLHFPSKELSQLIAFSPKSALAKWQNRQGSSAHSNRFPTTVSEKIKPAKNRTYTVINIWKFLTERTKDVFGKLWFSNCHPQNHQNFISRHSGYFSRFC